MDRRERVGQARVRYGLRRLEQQTAIKTVESTAEDIAAKLEAMPAQVLDNRGSAISAASELSRQ